MLIDVLLIQQANIERNEMFNIWLVCGTVDLSLVSV